MNRTKKKSMEKKGKSRKFFLSRARSLSLSLLHLKKKKTKTTIVEKKKGKKLAIYF